MSSRTRFLSAVLVAVGSFAAWSEFGLSPGRAPAILPVPVGSVPCPSGFEPSTKFLLLPDVPSGQFLPATKAPLPQCVLLTPGRLP